MRLLAVALHRTRSKDGEAIILVLRQAIPNVGRKPEARVQALEGSKRRHKLAS